MINILVFDDDRVQCNLIGELVQRCCPKECRIITMCSSVDLMNYVEDGKKIDILVSDIFLAGETVNGIDLVQKVLQYNGDTQIIYISGFMDYCVKVYETEHVYFLTKPVDENTLKIALEKAVARLEERNGHVLLIKNAGEIIRIHLNDIYYIESDRRKVKVVCRMGEYVTYDKLANIALQVGVDFVQCHKSWLVNMRYIKELKQEGILLENDMQIMVSQKRYKETRERFLDYLNRI